MFGTVFLLLLTAHSVIGMKKYSTCDDAIDMNCESNLIVIMDLNTTSNLANDLLKQCNAHHKCNLAINNDECMQVTYFCTPDVGALEITKSSTVHLKSKSSLMRVMNEGFKYERYSNLQNVDCRLKLIGESIYRTMNMTVRIYEFSSSANGTQFSLGVHKSSNTNFCADSMTFYTPYASFNGKGDWNISIAVSHPKSNMASKIRFWAELEVYPVGADSFLPSCSSQSGPSPTTLTGQPMTTLSTQPDNINMLTTDSPTSGYPNRLVSTVSAVVLGVLLLIALLTVAAAWVHRSPSRETDSIDSIYCDIDVGTLNTLRKVPEPNMTTRNLVPEISSNSQAIDNIFHGSLMTIMSHKPQYSDTEDSDDDVDDVEITDNDIYGSQMTHGSNDSAMSKDEKLINHAVYGSDMTIPSSEADFYETEIIENVIYGSEMIKPGLADEGACGMLPKRTSEISIKSQDMVKMNETKEKAASQVYAAEVEEDTENYEYVAPVVHVNPSN